MGTAAKVGGVQQAVPLGRSQQSARPGWVNSGVAVRLGLVVEGTLDAGSG